MAATDEALDTFPKLLAQHAKTRPDRPAYREKEYGIWITHTWAQTAENVNALAAGLHALGFGRGDKLIIVGDNRPRLYWAMCAAQSLGGVPVPVYQDAVAAEMAYVVEHAEARFAIGEDQEQIDKLLEIQKSQPQLKTIVYDDARGLRNYAGIVSYDSVQEKGRALLKEKPTLVADEAAKGKGSDPAIMLYTSGTTGRPKGVILSAGNVIEQARNSVGMEKLTDADDILAYLPMAWVGDNIFSYGQAYVAGFPVNCPESSATVLADLREIGPTYYFAPPRVFENLLTTVLIRMEDAGSLKRAMFRYFMDVAKRVGVPLTDGKPVGFADRLLYALGDLLVYGPLKNTLGMSRVRLAYTAGEAIGPDIFDFYRSLGINIKQLYGSTEASVFVTVQPDGEVRPDTVGKPIPGVELKIAENGEVMFRSPGVFQEYYKNPQATAETKTADGWVHTGDAGVIGSDGHLRIIDRAKDVGRLTSGAPFAPKYIENKLKFFPHIFEAVAFGDGRDHVCAFVNIDLTAVGSWAEKNNLSYASYQELAGHPRVYELIKSEVEKVNADLAASGELAASQIRRFLILPKQLDADDGELTRTRKVRRGFIAERYEPLVRALYDGSTRASIRTEVTFEDGRKGMVEGEMAVADARTFPAAPAAKAA